MSIEHGQVAALYMMFIIGFLGTFIFINTASKWLRIAGGIWIAVWCFPPLALIWIKGIFG